MKDILWGIAFLAVSIGNGYSVYMNFKTVRNIPLAYMNAIVAILTMYSAFDCFA